MSARYHGTDRVVRLYAVGVASEEYYMLRNVLVGAAALSMIATPALARPVAAGSAAKLSVVKSIPANARVGAPTQGSRKAMGRGLVIGLVAAAAVIIGIILIADGDDRPDSP